MTTTAEIYRRYHETLWRAWQQRQAATIAAAFPLTGGSEYLAHNWHHDEAAPIIAATWARWHRISARGGREYDRAEHQSQHGPHFRPLWCSACATCSHWKTCRHDQCIARRK